MVRVQDRNMQLLNNSIHNNNNNNNNNNNSLDWPWSVLNDNTSERDRNQHSNHLTNFL